MNPRQLSIIAGVSYLVIFFAAIFANFVVLEAITSDPLGTVLGQSMSVRLGAMAFLVAAVFDVIVAWVLYELYKGQVLATLSTMFRIIHAAIMGVGVVALLTTLSQTTDEAVLAQVTLFNTIWLIGLLFFGCHLILLGRIVRHIKIIPFILILAGAMYIIDTSAHFLLANYEHYADVFLELVAIPAIAGEMSFTLWLLLKGGRGNVATADNL